MEECPHYEVVGMVEDDDESSSRKSPTGPRRQATPWTTSRGLVGSLLVLANCVLFTVSTACAQALGGVVPMFERNLCRFAAQFCCVLLALIVTRPKFRLENWTRQGVSLCVVALAFSAFSVTFYEASVYLPIVTVAAIHVSGCMFLSTFVTFAFSRSCQWAHNVAIVLCTIGTILITQPPVLFGGSSQHTITRPLCVKSEFLAEAAVWCDTPELHLSNSTPTASTPVMMVNKSNFTTLDGCAILHNITNADICLDRNLVDLCAVNDDVSHGSSLFIGYVLAVASPAIYTVVMFGTSHGLKGVDAFVANFWISLCGILVSAVLMLIKETPVFPRSLTCLSLLLGHAFSASFAFILNVVSLQMITPNTFSVIITMETVLHCLAQYTVLADINPGHRNAAELIGAIIVVAGNLIAPIYVILRKRRKPADEPNGGK